MSEFLGTAYGTIRVQDGKLCLVDERCVVTFSLITPERAIAKRILAAEGESVRLVFEVCELTHLGYVIPRQIERRPEEYRTPLMEALIFTCTNTPGLAPSKSGDSELPHLIGHLMGYQGLASPSAFELSPVDFAVLMGQLRDSSCPWMSGMVVRGLLEFQEECGFDWYRVSEILNIQEFDDWLAEQASASTSLALPSTMPNAAQLENNRYRRRSISSRLRYEILCRDGHRCVDCGASAQDDPLVRLEIDHRLPVSKGGTNHPENLQTLCWACNNGKRDAIDHKLMPELGQGDPWVT